MRISSSRVYCLNTSTNHKTTVALCKLCKTSPNELIISKQVTNSLFKSPVKKLNLYNRYFVFYSVLF